MAKSGRARFVFGAAIGVAVSSVLFESVDIALANFLLTTAFAAMMGFAQVYAGRDTAGSRKFTRYAITGGVITMGVGIIIFLWSN